GVISLEELRVIMQCLGHKKTDLELRIFIRGVDTRGKGTIDFNDLTSMMASFLKKKASDCDIRQAFMVFDRDNDGVISSSELRFVMDIIGERLSDEQLKAMMKEADLDGDGAITCTYFTAVQTLLMGREMADRLKKIEISASL
ncbi:calmodulin, partial [Cadophora sp. MPI-SDFR-AT-0126]